ncbi:MAG: acetyl ornithine aminotransferase family protein [Sulfolobales archaeon]|nr:acetyl ornithine aminotransferase family protein [Sulfolobales archaeon]
MGNRMGFNRECFEDAPKIVVPPPGPKSRAVVKDDEELIMQSFSRWYPLVVKSGCGSIVMDLDGNLYIDFNSGIGVMNVGHNHPKVVEAIKGQADKLLHYSITDFLYEEAVEHAKEFLEIVPIEGMKKVFYCNSGTEGIEGALKVVKGYFKNSRQYVMTFIGSFHGRTLGSLSLSGSKPIHKKYFQPLLPGVVNVPYPDPYRCPLNVDGDECGDAVISYIEDYIFRRLVDGEDVAGIFIEPILGEGGYVVPPDNFLPKLRKLCSDYGILLVFDEVQSGMGRTGKWFAAEHWGVRPDVLVSSKALASGLPLGAVVGRAEVMSLPKGTHASTFGGNPVALAASRAVIRAIIDEGLLYNALSVGESIMKRALEWVDMYEIVGHVRGKGLMIGIELVRDKRTKKYADKELSKVLLESFKRGLAIIGAGYSVIRIAPPLTISEELAHRGLDILEDVIRVVDNESRKFKN